MTGDDRGKVLDADSGPAVDLVAEGGSARAIVWPGVGAHLRSMQRISLAPSGRTRRLQHPGEAVYYVISGSGSVADDTATSELIEGSMIHVEPGTPYEVTAGPDGIEIVGGPSPADPAMYRGLL